MRHAPRCGSAMRSLVCVLTAHTASAFQLAHPAQQRVGMPVMMAGPEPEPPTPSGSGLFGQIGSFIGQPRPAPSPAPEPEASPEEVDARIALLRQREMQLKQIIEQEEADAAEEAAAANAAGSEAVAADDTIVTCLWV